MIIAELARNSGSSGQLVPGVLCVLLAILLSVLAHTAPARATDTPVQGGPGGDYFRQGCSDGYAVGVYFRSGAFVDGIGLKCAAFNKATGTFSAPWNTPYHGGNGGGLGVEGLCPNTHYLRGITHGHTREGNADRYVDYVKLWCVPVGGGQDVAVCVQTGDGCWSYREGADSIYVGPRHGQCPDGEAATGLHGRSGIYVDAIGLICGPRPVAAVAAPLPKIRTIGKKKTTLVMATVRDDVDVYDGPGGEHNVIGMLLKGSRVPLLEPCKDGWCHVKANVPAGNGWVWGELLAVGG